MYKKINLETIAEISTFSKANFLYKLFEKCLAYFAENFETNSLKIQNLDSFDAVFFS